MLSKVSRSTLPREKITMSTYKYVRGLEHLKIENTIENRFHTKVTEKDKNGCMLWTAFINPKGYGLFKFNGRTMPAHRCSYELHFGKIPKGMCVLHKCDVRNCVNPDHLFLGTQIENIKDMCKKGRNSKSVGMDNPKSKLTDRKVKNIKMKLSQGITITKLAKQYKVAECTIGFIKSNQTWKHIS